jgi:hypothetical protein
LLGARLPDGGHGGERDMPGKSVKHWNIYHALRRKGFTKEKAARIANAAGRGRKRGKRR